MPLAATTVFAQGYSQEDRETLLARLDETRREVVVSTESVTHKQSTWTDDSNRWTILQVLEHIALTEDYLFGLLEKSLADAKPIDANQKLPDPSAQDAAIVKMLSDRSQKAKAPEEAKPRDKYRNRDEAMLAFTKSREKTATFVRTTQLDLRRYKMKTPLGELDAHQWILMITAHTHRHALQIEEVLRNPEYPAPQ